MPIRTLLPACRPGGGLAVVVGLLTVIALALPATSQSSNPPAEGFDAEASDPRAIEIADGVMAAMGGREAWDATRYLTWNFFGRRTHLWDKWSGDLRLESGDQLVLMNLNSHEGRAWKAGEELEGEALTEALDGAYRAWINDSYWLVMPYKLKDSGVTLGYVGEEQMEDGGTADVIRLTFEDVGVTPENKYHVFVARESGLVEQWAYYPKAENEEPAIVTPWADWRQFGEIMLSGDRGQFQLSDIAVFEEVPQSAFRDPAKVDSSTWR